MNLGGAVPTSDDMSVDDALDIAWAFVSRNPVAAEFPDELLDAAFECVCIKREAASSGTQDWNV